MSSGSSAARPIGTVIDTCQEWIPASTSRSSRGSMLAQRGPGDLRVGGHGDADGLEVLDGVHGGAPAPLHAAELVVHRLERVDRHRRALDARLARLGRALGGHPAAARWSS
jgi:hypothetical protein